MLKVTAKEPFTSFKSYSEYIYDGVTFWPEAVQYLLRTNFTSSAIINAILDVINAQKRYDEDDRKDSMMNCTASAIFGNDHFSE